MTAGRKPLSLEKKFNLVKIECKHAQIVVDGLVIGLDKGTTIFVGKENALRRKEKYSPRRFFADVRV
jgi:hypothetical protein